MVYYKVMLTDDDRQPLDSGLFVKASVEAVVDLATGQIKKIQLSLNPPVLTSTGSTANPGEVCTNCGIARVCLNSYLCFKCARGERLDRCAERIMAKHPLYPEHLYVPAENVGPDRTLIQAVTKAKALAEKDKVRRVAQYQFMGEIEVDARITVRDIPN